MDCKISGEQIIDFYLGNLSGAERNTVELHLSTCPDCLKEYFAFKRDLELHPSEAPRPSQAVWARVMAEFEAYSLSLWSDEGRKWMHTHKRKILVGGILAAAAAVLIIFSTQSRFMKSPSPKVESQSGEINLDEAIDSARQSPAHFNTI